MCLLPAIFFFFWEKVNSGKRRFLATERFSPTTWSGKFCLDMGAMYKWMVIHVHKTWWRKGLQDMVLPLIITPVTRWHRSASLAWSLILQHWGILTLFWYCALTSVLLLYKIVKDSDKMRIFSMKNYDCKQTILVNCAVAHFHKIRNTEKLRLEGASGSIRSNPLLKQGHQNKLPRTMPR